MTAKDETGGEEHAIAELEKAMSDALGGSMVESDTDESKKKEESASEKVDVEGIAKEETSKDEDTDNDTEENLKDFIKKEDDVKIPIKKTISKVEDGKDFRILDNGKVDVFAKHIVDDIESIKNDNARIYLKIFNSKNGRDKAEVIAKALGFSSDLTRSAGTVAKDTISAFVDAHKNGDNDRKQEVLDTLFPDSLKSDDSDNYSFVGVEAEKDKAEKVVSTETVKEDLKDLPFKKAEISDAISKHVDSKLYRYVDKDSSEEEISKTKESLVNELMDSSKLFAELGRTRFNQQTGEKMSVSDSLEIAIGKTFKKSSLPGTANTKVGGTNSTTKSNKTTEEVEAENLERILSGK